MEFIARSEVTSTSELRRIVICGSMSFYGAIHELEKQLRGVGVNCVIPEPEDEIKPLLSREDFELFKRKVSFRYLKTIRSPETFAVLAANYDKYGIPSYIGPNTFAEIAVAFAQSKRIFLLNGIPDIYEDELSAWGAVPLYGRLSPLISEYKLACGKEALQLPLFTNIQ